VINVVIIGGGWAGCSAALAARQSGAQVVVLERTDMLLGTGLVGGIMRNNGRYSATEELIAMGGGRIFEAIDGNLLHREVDFPGHAHAGLYNVGTMEPIIRRLLRDNEIELRFGARVTAVRRDGGQIKAVSGKQAGEPFEIAGDVFIETTGTAGPPAVCNKFGNGCAMCVLRCHSFGGRVSVAEKAGVAEMNGQKGAQTGAVSGSCKLHKESLSPELCLQLDSTGVVVVPVPAQSRQQGKLALKACQQYALDDFEENVIVLDTGHAKLMTPYYPLEQLRQIPGFENARFEDPYAGGIGNSVRYIGMSPRDDSLKVDGIDNLYCAGEKAGLLVGHTEAICTGTLAGHNAVRYIRRQDPLIISDSLCIGDAIRLVRVEMREKGELGKKFTFSGSVLFDRMKSKGLYTTDRAAIAARVERAGLIDIFSPHR
jgi:hypothetical protein